VCCDHLPVDSQDAGSYAVVLQVHVPTGTNFRPWIGPTMLPFYQRQFFHQVSIPFMFHSGFLRISWDGAHLDVAENRTPLVLWPVATLLGYAGDALVVLRFVWGPARPQKSSPQKLGSSSVGEGVMAFQEIFRYHSVWDFQAGKAYVGIFKGVAHLCRESSHLLLVHLVCFALQNRPVSAKCWD
jgi:hypothetical protein